MPSHPDRCTSNPGIPPNTPTLTTTAAYGETTCKVALMTNPITLIANVIIALRPFTECVFEAKLSFTDDEHSARSGTNERILISNHVVEYAVESLDCTRLFTHLTKHGHAAKSHSKRRTMWPLGLVQISPLEGCRVLRP